MDGDQRGNSDQARLARLTLEGSCGSEEDIPLMIKTIIETTGCTQSQAEIALLDCDNNLYSAVDHCLEAGDKLDSWTEQKGPKKEKKKSDDGSYSKSYGGRGRGSVARGGRGRSTGAPRGGRENRETRERENKEGGPPTRSSRGGFERPYVGRGGRGGGTRGGYSREVAPSTTLDADAFTAGLDDNSTKVDTTVAEVQQPVEESVTATVSSSSAPAPISFAVIALAGHQKEALRKQAQNPQPAAPPRRSFSPQPPLPSATSLATEEPAPAVFSEPETSHQPEREDGLFQSYSSALAEEEQTVQTLQHPGVEFVGFTPTNVHDYSFGFVEAPPSPQIPAAGTSDVLIAANNENLLNSSRIMPKQVEPERTQIPNGDYNLGFQATNHVQSQCLTALIIQLKSVGSNADQQDAKKAMEAAQENFEKMVENQLEFQQIQERENNNSRSSCVLSNTQSLEDGEMRTSWNPSPPNPSRNG